MHTVRINLVGYSRPSKVTSLLARSRYTQNIKVINAADQCCQKDNIEKQNPLFVFCIKIVGNLVQKVCFYGTRSMASYRTLN